MQTMEQILEELPLLKVTHLDANEAPQCDEEASKAGFYYYFGFAGCLPDGDMTGPFETALAAANNAYLIHAC